MHEKPNRKALYTSHPCMGCVIYGRGFMKKHIIDNDGDWWQQYKGQGVAWMPGKEVGNMVSATDARCSANQGPPTRICACKSKSETGQKCGSHGECTSGFCMG